MQEPRLRFLEGDFLRFLERSPDPVLVQQQGMVVFANEAFALAVRAKDAKSVIGRPILSLVAPVDAERMAALVAQPDPEGTRATAEVHLVRDDGTAGLFEYSGTRLDHESGFSAVLIFRDLSAQREQAEALRRAYEQFRLVFESAPTAIALADSSGRYLRVNQAMCKIFGYSEEELVGKPASIIAVPGDASTEAERIRITGLEAGEHAMSPRRYRAKDGRVIEAERYLSIVGDSSGAPASMVVQILDVTERRAIERSLRESDARHRALMLAGERQKQIVELLQAIAAIANESITSDNAIAHSLALVAEFADWVVGHAFKVADGELISRRTWYEKDLARYKQFRHETERGRFPSGAGLSGRALASKRPAWNSSLAQDRQFVRAALAEKHGLRSGFAFPVLDGDEVATVVEFFSEREEEPSEEIISLMNNVAIQLGRVIERERHAAEVAALSLTDELTGLHNRRGFMALAAQVMRAAARSKRPSTVLFADLDGLKQINDQRGHEAGDAAIQAFAKILRRSFRDGDIVSRFGGDEFVVLLEGSLAAVEAARQRLNHNLEQHQLADPNGPKLSASIGLVEMKPDGESLESVVARADALMYANKKAKKSARDL